jgi:hypothetical protein
MRYGRVRTARFPPLTSVVLPFDQVWLPPIGVTEVPQASARATTMTICHPQQLRRPLVVSLMPIPIGFVS